MPYRADVCPADLFRRPAEFSKADAPATVEVDESNGEFVAAALASHVLLMGGRKLIQGSGDSITAWCDAQNLSRRRWSQLFRGTTWLDLPDIVTLTGKVAGDVLGPALQTWVQAQPPPRQPSPDGPEGLAGRSARTLRVPDDLTSPDGWVKAGPDGADEISARAPDLDLTHALQSYAAGLARAGGRAAPATRAYRGDVIMASGEADGALVIECKSTPVDAKRGVLDRHPNRLLLLTMAGDGTFGVDWRDLPDDGADA